jgi:RimJ/RimL family protein N-acetyltransferase
MGCTAVAMRIATQADSARLHAWRNHPDIRSVSANSAPIDGTTHEAWLAATLADADRALLIGERNGEEVGVVRFDLHGTSAEVSIYLAPGHAGGGDGGDLLAAAEFWLAEERPEIRTLDAHVLRDNARSHGLFAAAGYRPSSTKYSKSLHR